uniref:UDP-N-acetylglucosamine 4-epimerase n=1 Tax=Aceria tosichella TaxID=561515 RepID=A0A6G1SIC0_9ACAR
MARDNEETSIETQINVLVTGGAGYVGSHCVLLLLEQNYGVVVVDNCSNAYIDEEQQIDANGNNVEIKPESLKRVEELAQRRLLAYYRVDLVDQNNQAIYDEIFIRHQVRVVLHFAAFKSVNESIERPMDYYTNNLIGTINLVNAMKRYGCKRMIFSSSATVYGLPQYLPVDENHQVGQNILNPYGRTKFMIEQMLMDICNPKANDKQYGSVNSNNISNNNNNNNNGNANGVSKSSTNWNIISLRYFNPVGAHPSGYIGEHTQGVPNNLMPYIAQVSIKKRDRFYVFGNDFDTIDGTGVRDYIHIMDLANGHLCALKHLLKQDLLSTTSVDEIAVNGGLNGGQQQQHHDKRYGYKVFNLGTGVGYSVLQTIKTFEEVNNVKIPYEITKRREGDAGEVYADASLAFEKLGWRAKYSLIEMCRDTYKWQSSFPDGFKTKSPNGNNKEPKVINHRA